MSEDSTTQTHATTWLQPEQVEAMRTATVEESTEYLAERNDALIALLYDSGLRVSETVNLDTKHLHLDESYIQLPPEIQKDFSTENSPVPKEINLSKEPTDALRNYMDERWKETEAVFPSREAERMTEQSVRNVIRNAAIAADVQPYTSSGRGEPDFVTPRTLRHSLAYRMLVREDGNTMYDVTNRLRHATIQTTERKYGHFAEM